jgi:uncharacterized protein (DUF1778 family)
VRLTPDALATLKEAAAWQQQDMTSFVLGAALDRARSILLEENVMRLTPAQARQLEEALDIPPEENVNLARFFERMKGND